MKIMARDLLHSNRSTPALTHSKSIHDGFCRRVSQNNIFIEYFVRVGVRLPRSGGETEIYFRCEGNERNNSVGITISSHAIRFLFCFSFFFVTQLSHFQCVQLGFLSSIFVFMHRKLPTLISRKGTSI